MKCPLTPSSDHRFSSSSTYCRACLGSGPSGFAETTPDDLREIAAYIEEHRTGDGPFDLVLSGPGAADPAEHADDMARLAAAGLTWWLEGIGLPDRTPEEWRAVIREGPPS